MPGSALKPARPDLECRRSPGQKGKQMKKPCRFYILPGMRVRVVFEDDTSIIMTFQEVKEKYGEGI